MGAGCAFGYQETTRVRSRGSVLGQAPPVEAHLPAELLALDDSRRPGLSAAGRGISSYYVGGHVANARDPSAALAEMVVASDVPRRSGWEGEQLVRAHPSTPVASCASPTGLLSGEPR